MRLSFAPFLGAATLALLPTLASAGEITVFAAASLKGPLDAVAADWQEATGHVATISYGGSSALAKQIEAGAPAQVFLSASEAWMDKLEKAGSIDPATRRDYLGNTLVLIAHDPAAQPVTLQDAAFLGTEKLAMALVDSVPAGQYGKEALSTLGLWTALEPAVVQAEDVKATLNLVVSGEAGYGIVYGSDAKDQKVKVVADFPATSHTPILYPGAAVAPVDPLASDFLTFLAKPEELAHFTEAGFTLP